MSETTICRRTNEEVESVAGLAVLTRTADFEELFRELVDEAGRALEAGDLEWCALLQGVLIPKIETEGLGLPCDTLVAA